MDFPPSLAATMLRVQQLEDQKQQNPRVTEQLIQLYEQMLGQCRPDEYPDAYSFIQNGLGEAYSELPTGDRGVNLARAIACYEGALRVWTPETEPHKYAETQRKLGFAYWSLPIRD